MLKQKNKIFLIILGVILVLSLFIFLINNSEENIVDNQEGENAPEVIVGNDRDQNNCIGSAGYTWCSNKNKCFRPFEEFCLDGQIKIVDDIKSETNISLAYFGEENFDWHFDNKGTGKIVNIPGSTYLIEGASREEYQKIENYIDRNYDIDIYNLADGVSGGLRGFYVNYMVCVLNSESMEMVENENGLLEPVDNSMSIKLICGYFNKNNYN